MTAWRWSALGAFTRFTMPFSSPPMSRQWTMCATRIGGWLTPASIQWKPSCQWWAEPARHRKRHALPRSNEELESWVRRTDVRHTAAVSQKVLVCERLGLEAPVALEVVGPRA